MFENILLSLTIYVFYIIAWLMINVIAYSISIVTKKKIIQNFISGLALAGLYLLNFLIGIGIVFFTISLLLDGNILWFLIMIFVGGGILSQLLWLIQLPFVFITAYFETKLEEKDFEDGYVAAEILNKDGDIIGLIENDNTISRRLALYFLANFSILFIGYYIFPNPNDQGVFSNVVFSAIQTLVVAIFIGFFYLIYHKIRYGLFFEEDKRLTYIKILKIELIILVVLHMITLVYL